MYDRGMGRFISRAWWRLWCSLREQLVAAILAVMILAFQLWLGMIPKDARSNAWWSLAWPYLILLFLYLVWHCIGAWFDLRKEDAVCAHDLRAFASDKLP
jgi:hypothetical protein